MFSPEKVQIERQWPSMFSSHSTFPVSHFWMGYPNGIFSQWALGFMLPYDLLIPCFSTKLILCSCPDAEDLYRSPHLARCPLSHERLRPMLR